MVSKAEHIKYVKSIIEKVLVETFMDDSRYAMQLFKDYLNAMADISEYQLLELCPLVYELLKHKNELVRDEAVMLLGATTRLHVSEFKDISYKIFLVDPSLIVKRTALAIWGEYYLESKNPDVLRVLYEILMNNDDIPIRTEAYSKIFTTVDMNHPAYDRIGDYSALLYCSSNDEFNRIANWVAIDGIIKQYAPDVISKRE